MAQRISNLYQLVTLPWFYNGIQRTLGARAARARYVAEVLRPTENMKILDCGCGPAGLLPYFHNADYTGIDLNPKHIAYAKELYPDRGQFIVADVTRDLPEGHGVFDLVIVSALLHHLADEDARRLVTRAVELTRPGGRVETIDAVWLPGQNPVAWALNKLDSGLNIRSVDSYVALTAGLPVAVGSRVFRDLLQVPYDHFSMTLTPQT